jgi:uncharacterized protein (DUF1778 family)
MKAESLKIRVGADEKEAFQQAAEVAGISLSAWMRERLRKLAAQELNEAGITPGFLKKLRG